MLAIILSLFLTGNTCFIDQNINLEFENQEVIEKENYKTIGEVKDKWKPKFGTYNNTRYEYTVMYPINLNELT